MGLQGHYGLVNPGHRLGVLATDAAISLRRAAHISGCISETQAAERKITRPRRYLQKVWCSPLILGSVRQLLVSESIISRARSTAERCSSTACTLPNCRSARSCALC